MIEVQASEAKTHLLQLLTRVEQGETISISRHGRQIAFLVPKDLQRQSEIRQAMDDIRALRNSFSGVSLKDLMDERHDGHRY